MLTADHSADHRAGRCADRRADQPSRSGWGVKPGLLLKAIVQAGLASYVYHCDYKGKKSVFRSGG